MFDDLWIKLDGNKTIIGQYLLLFFTQIVKLPQPFQFIVLTIIGLWTGVSTVSHIKKEVVKARARRLLKAKQI